MELVLHSHNATVSDVIRERAERLVRRLAPRFGRVVDATVRFADDGPLRRVELHQAGGRRVVCAGTGRYFGPALAHAGAGLRAQLEHSKRTRRERSRDANAVPLAEAS